MKLKLIIASIMVTTLSVPALADPYDRQYPKIIMSMHQTDKAVDFDHQAHLNVDCSQCHHPQINEVESFTPYKCSSCHSTKGEDKAKSNAYFKIIHSKKAKDNDPAQRCLACHQQEQQQRDDNEVSLTNCTNSSCHK
ncbi:cytochrome c3 family protein [Ferrimonas lipolytica]|uniref:Cytochrome c3 family protein n=1 Tax=Ferrimonas lipolytica TaxID=2724191 RepID=A0A6H1UIJ2_9GAMM|nr:cytochrome c3 family protein [Ferrimonas lipolytica]QIZ77612.1 cytochrome c3 family protein [Ferrimonas lipolytica]